MTSAEALRELRGLLQQAAAAGNWRERDDMLWTAREIRESGADPIIGIRLRRWRRRAAMRG